MNILAAKSKQCILNVSPAGCGKSAATSTVHRMLGDMSTKYTSLTLASLHRRKGEFNGFTGHLVIDDLGGEKSLWSRLATITVLANLISEHFVQKLTMSYDINIKGFYGSASLNVQPILMNSLVQSDDWIAVVRDKVLRYYHLIRPFYPKPNPPTPETWVCSRYEQLGTTLPLTTVVCYWLHTCAGHTLGNTNRRSQTNKSEENTMVPAFINWINTMVTCTLLTTHPPTIERVCIIRRQRRRQLLRLSTAYQITTSDAVREVYYQYDWIRVWTLVREQRLLYAGRNGKSQSMRNGPDMRRLQNSTRNSNITTATNGQMGTHTERDTNDSQTNRTRRVGTKPDRSQR